MPVVRPYPIGEVSPQPIPDVAPSVPAAGEIALFGGNRARDLQLAGEQLGQASDTLFALYQRHAQEANDTRVQDLNNRFITGKREILQTGPDAYYNQSGADAIAGTDVATGKRRRSGMSSSARPRTTTSGRSSARSSMRISPRRPPALSATPPGSRQSMVAASRPTR